MSVKVNAAAVQKNFCKYQNIALTEPVTVTKYGRESVVILSAAEYRRMRRRYREARRVEDLPEAEIEAISRSAMSAKHASLDEEFS